MSRAVRSCRRGELYDLCVTVVDVRDTRSQVRVDEHGLDSERERDRQEAPRGPSRNAQNTSDRNVVLVRQAHGVAHELRLDDRLNDEVAGRGLIGDRYARPALSRSPTRGDAPSIDAT
jgi:hypothetical protein